MSECSNQPEFPFCPEGDSCNNVICLLYHPRDGPIPRMERETAWGRRDFSNKKSHHTKPWRNNRGHTVIPTQLHSAYDLFGDPEPEPAALSNYVQASNSKQFDFGVLENIKFEVGGELYNSPRIHQQQPKPKPPPKPQPKQTSNRYLEWLWDPEHSNSVITNNKGVKPTWVSKDAFGRWEYMCGGCGFWKTDTAFSHNDMHLVKCQALQPSCRTCKAAVKAQTFRLRACSVCEQKFHQGGFSPQQWKKLPKIRVCRKCESEAQ